MTPSARDASQAIGRHAAEHDGVHLGEIERHRREARALDRGDAVFREAAKHDGVLIGDRGAKLREHAAGRLSPAAIE